MAETEWPYDAPKDDPLTALRIPVVSTLYPGWHYMLAVCVNDDTEDAPDRGIRPNDREVAMLRSALDFALEWYTAYWRQRMAERPFDIDGGYNSLVFIKRAEGDWAYRRRSWSGGPQVRPSPFYDEQPLDLPGVLDLKHQHGSGDPNPKWEAWKNAHPEVFAAKPVTAR